MNRAGCVLFMLLRRHSGYFIISNCLCSGRVIWTANASPVISLSRLYSLLAYCSVYRAKAFFIAISVLVVSYFYLLTVVTIYRVSKLGCVRLLCVKSSKFNIVYSSAVKTCVGNVY